MRPGSLAFIASVLFVLAAGGAQGQSYFEGKWRHNDADEGKFGGGTGPFDVIDTQNGDFYGKFDIRGRNECANSGNRDFYISGHIDGKTVNVGQDARGVATVTGTLTRCTNPELVKKCKHDKTYKVPFDGHLAYLGDPKILTMVITFQVQQWKIPQCKQDGQPQPVQVEYQLALPKQPQQAQPSRSFDDCLREGVGKFLTLDPTPLIDRCK